MSFNFFLLKIFRSRQKISQKLLSKKTGISVDVICAMENGKRIKQINYLMQLINSLDLSDEEILLLIKGE